MSNVTLPRVYTHTEALKIVKRIGNPDVNGCWPWMGYAEKHYGRSWLGGKPVYVHRLLYERMRGQIPTGLHIDHLCRNRGCVNPWHLEPVTPGENVLRGDGVTARNANKASCVRGHQFTEASTHTNRHGWRICRPCEVIRNREERRRRRAKS